MKEKEKGISAWWLVMTLLVIGVIIGNLGYFILFAGIPLAFHFSKKAGLPAWPIAIVLTIVAVSVAAANFPDIAQSTRERIASYRLTVNQWIRPLNAGVDSVDAQASDFFSEQAKANAVAVKTAIEDSVKSERWSAARGWQSWKEARDTLRLSRELQQPQPKVQPVSYSYKPAKSQVQSIFPPLLTISKGDVKKVIVGSDWQEIDVNLCGIELFPSDTMLIARANSTPRVSAPNDTTKMPFAPKVFVRSKSGNPIVVTATGW